MATSDVQVKPREFLFLSEFSVDYNPAWFCLRKVTENEASERKDERGESGEASKYVVYRAVR